jgi:RNA polymerase sigma-70 factor (ECF subfamily)
VPDDELVERCRSGDEQAWRELHRAQYPFVHRVARKLGAREDEVDDVVQEVFIIAHRRLGTFTHGRLPTWLYKITSNLVFSRNRGRRLRETLFSWFSGGDAQEEVAGPERLVEAREAERDVAKILSRMSDKKREVFVLFELEGLPGEEISELVGCPVQTVWTRLHYARREFEQLARELGVVEAP